MRQKSPVRTAVVGCGYWGKNLVRTFSALSELRACVDSDPAVRARIAAQYPTARVAPQIEAVLADPSIDAVVLATPAPTHADLAVAALAAGKHVFVEKPLALREIDAARVVNAAGAAGRILMVGHLLEYHPAVNYLRDLIRSGDLGKVYYMYSQRVNLGKVRAEENALWSLAPHDISVALYLMEEEPEEVQATGQAFLQGGVEDVAFLTLKFGSGRVAQIHVSWLDPHKERRLTIVGSRKMATFDDTSAQEKIRIYDKGVDRRMNEAADYAGLADLLALREGDIVIPRIPPQEPLALECGEFLRAVESGIPPRSDGHDGLAVVRVLEAAERALRANQIVFDEARAWAR